MALFDDIFGHIKDDPYRTSPVIMDLARRAVELSSEFSATTGWKNAAPFPFSQSFKGAYVKYLPDTNETVLYDWSQEEAVRLAVHPAENGGIEILGADAEALNLKGEWDEGQAPLLCDKVLEAMRERVMTDENKARAAKWSHYGHIVIPFVKLEHETVFGISEPCPLGLKKTLEKDFAPLYGSCTFISARELSDSLRDWCERNLYPGIEPSLPQMDTLYYDGANIDNRISIQLPGSLTREQKEADEVILDRLKCTLRNIRRELEIAGGCAEDHDYNIRFRDVLYPSADYFRKSAAFLLSNCGASVEMVMTVREGKVVCSLPVGDGEVQKTKEMTPEQVEAFVRKAVLNEENIDKAVSEVRDNGLAEVLDKPEEAEDAIYIEGLLNRQIEGTSVTVVKAEHLGETAFYHYVTSTGEKGTVARRDKEFYTPVVKEENSHFVRARSACYVSWENRQSERFSFVDGQMKSKSQSKSMSI